MAQADTRSPEKKEECTLSCALHVFFSVMAFAWHIAAVVLLMFKYEQNDRCEDFIMRDWKTELKVLSCDASDYENHTLIMANCELEKDGMAAMQGPGAFSSYEHWGTGLRTFTEMRQCIEHEQQDGTYTYSVEWSDQEIDSTNFTKTSASFQQNCAVDNPRWVEDIPRTGTVHAEMISIGAFYVIDPTLISAVPLDFPVEWPTPLPKGWARQSEEDPDMRSEWGPSVYVRQPLAADWTWTGAVQMPSSLSSTSSSSSASSQSSLLSSTSLASTNSRQSSSLSSSSSSSSSSSISSSTSSSTVTRTSPTLSSSTTTSAATYGEGEIENPHQIGLVRTRFLSNNWGLRDVTLLGRPDHRDSHRIVRPWEECWDYNLYYLKMGTWSKDELLEAVQEDADNTAWHWEIWQGRMLVFAGFLTVYSACFWPCWSYCCGRMVGCGRISLHKAAVWTAFACLAATSIIFGVAGAAWLHWRLKWWIGLLELNAAVVLYMVAWNLIPEIRQASSKMWQWDPEAVSRGRRASSVPQRQDDDYDSRNKGYTAAQAAPRASAANASAEVADDNEAADVESNPDFSFPGPVAADGSGWV